MAEKEASVSLPVEIALSKIADQLAAMTADAEIRESRNDVQMQSHRLQAATSRLEALERPYRSIISALVKDVEVLSIEAGASFERHGVRVGYRNGYETVSYDAKLVDPIMESLRKRAPDLAASLAAARRTKAVLPKVTVEV